MIHRINPTIHMNKHIIRCFQYRKNDGQVRSDNRQDLCPTHNILYVPHYPKLRDLASVRIIFLRNNLGEEVSPSRNGEDQIRLFDRNKDATI